LFHSFGISTKSTSNIYQDICLKSSGLEFSPDVPSGAILYLLRALQSCPKLELLSLDRYKTPSLAFYDGLPLILASFWNLRRLELRCSSVAAAFAEQLSKSLPALTHLKSLRLDSATERGLDALMLSLPPSVTSLDLYNLSHTERYKPSLCNSILQY